MRLLIATDHYPPFIGGAHRQSALLAHAMAGRGHDVSVTTVWDGRLPRVERSGGVVVHRVRQMRTIAPRLIRDARQRHHPPFPDPVTIRDLHRIMADEPPELIHAYGWIAFSVALALVGKKVPLLLSARDYGYFCATRTLLQREQPCTGPGPLKCLSCAGAYYGRPKGWVGVAGVAASRPMVARKMTGLHSVSTFVDQTTAPRLRRRRDGPREAVRFVIPPFLDRNRATAADHPEVDRCLAQLPPEPFILFVGALRRLKGICTLFEAYERLEAPPPLVLIGTFESDSPTRFPTNTTVIADAPHAAVLAAWDRAAFGVLPSLWPEPFGSTVLEGMSRGKPVIGTAPGGHVDMLDGCGILVPPGDAIALERSMRLLIDDPGLRETVGRAARVRAEQFTASVVVSQYEDAYRELLRMSEQAVG